jgi:spore coat protein CotH
MKKLIRLSLDVLFSMTFFCCGVALRAAEAGGGDPGAEFFAEAMVHTVRVEIDEAGVASLTAQRRTDVNATVTVDDVVRPDVAVHVKGGPGSLRALHDKPALTLKFGKFTDGQTLRGLRKIHLNNSTQDPSYMNEMLAGELFNAAGVPSPRVTYAMVELNGKKRGLYVLKEGFTKDFLARYFKKTNGNLYDPGPGPSKAPDIGQPMERSSGNGPDDWSDLKAVVKAMSEPDPGRRWERLEELLDMERVLSFMAMEIMTCHTDGYCLSTGNHRVYVDADTGKLLLFPHGMDQMFGSEFAGRNLTCLPIEPRVVGAVAQAILQTPEGRRRYRARVAELFAQTFQVEVLTHRVDEIAARLRPVIASEGPKAVADFDAAVAQKRTRIAQRAGSLAEQLNFDQTKPLPFTNQVAPLPAWTMWDDRRSAILEKRDESGKSVLSIAGTNIVHASWRTRLTLETGRYRFEGMARTAGVTGVANRDGQGAALRLVGKPVSKRLTGDSPWEMLSCEFEVTETSAPFELLCELRGEKGSAFFATDSLRLVRVSQ